MFGDSNFEDAAGQLSPHSVQATAERSTQEPPSKDKASDILEFLAPYGFFGINELLWRGPPPELTIQVTGHDVVGGHTMYNLVCGLVSCPTTARGARSAVDLNWKTSLRLTQLRRDLHDPVRKALGSSYPTYFCNVPFAHHLRPKGTTARLDAWCKRLGSCVTQSLVPPWIAAAALKVLSAPPPARRTYAMERTDEREVFGTTSRGLEADKVSLKPPSEVATRTPSEVAASSNGEVGGDAAVSDAPTSPASFSDMTSETAKASEQCAEASDQEGSSSACDSDDVSVLSDFDGCPVADDNQFAASSGSVATADSPAMPAGTARGGHAAGQTGSDLASGELSADSISSILAVATAAELDDMAECASVPPADSIASILEAATAEPIDESAPMDAAETS